MSGSGWETQSVSEIEECGLDEAWQFTQCQVSSVPQREQGARGAGRVLAAHQAWDASHLFSPLEPVHPALGAGPEAFRLDSRAHVWMPEPLPGQAPWCRSEIPFPFGKLFSFQPKQLPLCQSGLEVNYVQLCFKIPLPINSCQPLSVWC